MIYIALSALDTKIILGFDLNKMYRQSKSMNRPICAKLSRTYCTWYYWTVYSKVNCAQWE